MSFSNICSLPGVIYEKSPFFLLRELINIFAYFSSSAACKRLIKSCLSDDSFKEFDRLYGIRSQIVHTGKANDENKFGVHCFRLKEIVELLLKNYS